MTTCPVCNAQHDATNFGGLCTPCETKRQARTQRTRIALRAIGQQDSDLGRAIRA